MQTANRLYNVAIYGRLSKEDKPQKSDIVRHTRDSLSISNQVSILSDYAISQGWSVKEVYTDDGYSGGNFERPAFQKMIEDAKVGKINLILVKDLSRLGRDSVGVGTYTDQVFPALNCRFVALGDGIDTARSDNDIMPFLTLMNDFHLKDLSRKLKSVLRAKAENGECLMAYAPYGYKKDENNRHKLVIDYYASEVVNDIFKLRLQNKGYGAIAKILNEKQLLAPRAYQNGQAGKAYAEGTHNLWKASTVKSILTNDIYLGHLTQMKTGTLSYKNHSHVKKDEENWVCIKNAHEAIIDEDTWNDVQNVDLCSHTNRAKPQISLFSGLLHCKDCGGRLGGKIENRQRKNNEVAKCRIYGCALFHQTGRSTCSSHRINETELLDILKSDIQKQATLINYNELEVRDSLQKRLCKDLPELTQIESELKTVSKRLVELNKIAVKLYEDKLSGIISEGTFVKLINDSEAEKIEKSAKFETLEQMQAEIKKACLDITKWFELIRKYSEIQTIDREFLLELISKIVVGEKALVDGVKHQDIKITYRFVGLLDDELTKIHTHL